MVRSNEDENIREIEEEMEQLEKEAEHCAVCTTQQTGWQAAVRRRNLTKNQGPHLQQAMQVMLARGVMCDVRQSAPRGGPLIGAEPRGFPPGEKSLVAWRSRGGWTGVRFGTRNEKY